MLEHLGVISISWRQVGSDSLARFTLPEAAEAERLPALAERAGLAELAYLATCNRVELIFARRSGTPAADLRPLALECLTGERSPPGEAERRLRAWAGEGAAEHLFLVAAGLDSACVGETEIVGQVRRCYERSLQLGLCGPSLALLFDEALKIAAQVRGETRVGEGRVSLAEIAVEQLQARIAQTPGRIALLGVSPMTERAARALSVTGVPLLVVNRSVDGGTAFAHRIGADFLSLAEFRREPPPVEAMLAATGAGRTLLEEPTLERLAARTPSGQAPLVIDMAVPGDVSVTACAKLGIRRLGMDQIVERAESNRSARLLEAAQARERVDDALAELHETFAERVYGPLFGALQQRYRHTAQEGITRLMKRKEFRDIDAEQRAAIEKWAEVLARRFAHIPCLGLRGLIHDGPDGSLEAFLGGLDPQFAAELRAALTPDEARNVS